MTKTERQRVSALVRAAEYLLVENLALKLVLENRQVRNWQSLVEKLLTDKEILAGVHLRFGDVYDEIAHAEDPSQALERVVSGLPRRKPN